jgi:hypothetical protein
MGLGKTAQAICFLGVLSDWENDRWVPRGACCRGRHKPLSCAVLCCPYCALLRSKPPCTELHGLLALSAAGTQRA